MANLSRVLLKLFGTSGASSNFAKFGSQAAAAPVKTKDILTIQSLSAWLNGWQDAVNASNKAPFLEDMNGLLYVFGYQLCYLLQKGIPEYDASTTYYEGDMVRLATSAAMWSSRVDNNTGNALPAIGASSFYWQNIYPPYFADLLGSIGLSQIPDGLITAAKIISLATTQLTGLIESAQIDALDISKLTGGPVPISLGGTGVTKQLIGHVSYIGNNAASRTIAHGMGSTPVSIIVSRCDSGSQAPILWDLAYSAGLSRLMTGATTTSGITAVDSTNVTIGTTINQNTITYVMSIFASQ